jgi:hypothetical protein
MDGRHLVVVVSANIDKLRAELAKSEAIIGTTTSALKTASKAYDGANTIAHANAAMLAVEKIGGATKLTDSEQRRLIKTLDEGLAKYEALGKSPPASMLALRDAAVKANLEHEKTPTLMQRIESRAVALGAAVGTFLGNMAWSAVQKLGGELMAFVDKGSKLSAVESSFERLSRGANQHSGEMLSSLQTGTRGLVANYDLMTAANKAMLLGLPVTSTEMGNLAKTATTLGKAMGLDATKSLDDLITALGRSSPMILDNLGLTVKVGEANANYAREMEIVGRELTDAESKMAFYLEAMRKAELRTMELQDESRTFGEIVGAIWTSIGNRVAEASSVANVGLGEMLSGTKGLRNWWEALKESWGQDDKFMAALRRIKDEQAAISEGEKQQIRDLVAKGQKASEIAALYRSDVTPSIMKYIASLAPAPKIVQELSEEEKRRAKALEEVRKSEMAVSDTVRASILAMNDRKVSTSAIALATGAHEVQIRRVIDAEREAVKASEAADKAAEKLAKERQKRELEKIQTFNQVQREIHAGLEAEAKKRDKVSLDTFEAAQAADQKMTLLTKTGLDRRLAEISMAEQAEIRSAQKKFDEGSAFYHNIEDEIRERYQYERDLAAGTQSTIVDRMHQQGVITRAEQQALVDGMKADHAQMVASGQYTYDQLEEAERRWRAAQAQLSQAALFRFLREFDDYLSIAESAFDAIGGLGNETVEKIAMVGQRIVDTARQGAEAMAAFASGDWVQGAIKSIGAIGTALQGLFKGNETKKAREEFADSMGLTLDGLMKKLQSMGAEGQRLANTALNVIGKHDEAGNRRWMQEVQAYFTQHEEMMGGLSLTWQEAEEIMREFGISAENSGRALEQAKIVEQGDNIGVKWRQLTAMGVDFQDVTAGMADEVQALINRSLEMGIELPASLRRPTEEMIRLGLLTDQSGEKLESIGQLTFAESLTESVSLLVKKLDEMIDALGGRLPDAISRIPKDIDVGINFHIGSLPDFPGGGEQVHHDMADGGFGTVNRPTLFRVAEVPGSTEQFAFSGVNKTFSGGVPSGGAAAEDRKLQSEIAGLRSDMSMLMRDQPRAIAVAISDAMALTGGRR